ncbi:unnamed protein product [Adineta steineri]|uniref:Uncharacterized protein n=1 Tax=Adineta steineri TaxID=433720 RepID=A0A815PZ95_9BILA|nr:unnamed protein product [Adineta steineri]CAF1456481.1 unnamed protein product [Adineta steineri]CAF1503476.1 unnamed protein product [Adineta steineri]CAF3781685.1 unnamed protein product [Adineta steineri]CAF3837165.1 unnamed protein product [Adineta steineri]
MIKPGFPCYSLEEIMFEEKFSDLLIGAILIALPTPFCPLTNTLSDEYLMFSITLISLFIIIHSIVSVGITQNFFNVLNNTNLDDICDYHLIYRSEFLRAEKSEYDALHPIKQIFDYIDGKPKINSFFYINILEETFSPSGSLRSRITVMESAKKAESLKLVHNFSNATRISFPNCCAQLASSLSLKLNKFYQLYLE